MTNKEMNISLKAEVEQLKADKETLQAYVNVFGACAKEIGRDRLEEVCEAIKYIGQTGYAINIIGMQNKRIVEPVDILRIEIWKNSIWLEDDEGICYRLSDINERLFFGENAKHDAEKYAEKYLTAQSGKGE